VRFQLMPITKPMRRMPELFNPEATER
jgi:hypothetical protein